MRRAQAALALAAALAAAGTLSCAKGEGASLPPLRVVVVTPPESAAPLEFRGAEALARAYPAKAKAGEVLHALLPDAPRAGGREAAVAAFIADAAQDPLVKAILVAPAPAGTAEGFRRLGTARPGLFRVAGGSREDSLVIEAAADLVVDLDRVNRAYLTAWAARKMGARTLLAAYSSEEASDPVAARERAIMSAASAELGISYVAMTAPAGVDGAAWLRLESVGWLLDYGPATALYCSSRALAAPLVERAIAGDGILVDAAASASRDAYAEALGLDLSVAKGDAKRERALLDDAVAARGARGRFGLWEEGYAESSVEGLGELALRVASGSARRDSLEDLLAALRATAPAAPWLAAYDVDPVTGVKAANRILLRQDIYALGRGYLQSALQAVPSKYLLLGAKGD